jgi:hypothetical protein
MLVPVLTQLCDTDGVAAATIAQPLPGGGSEQMPNYQKYQDHFDEIGDLGNPSIGRFMLSDVLSKMETTCEECQRDRMRCTLRPMCPDRVFLNILIALQAAVDDLPSFCYQVHLRNLDTYLKSRAQRTHEKEPRYPLQYFGEFIIFKKDDPAANMRAFAAYLQRETQSEVHSYALDDRWYLGVGTGIFVVDLNRRIVSLDPDGDVVQRPALETLIVLLAEMHRLDVTILKDLESTWYLRVSSGPLKAAQLAEVVQPRLHKLEKSWSHVASQTSNHETELLVGLDPASRQGIRLQTLRETLQLLAEIAQAAPRTEAKVPISVAKPSKPTARTRR